VVSFQDKLAASHGEFAAWYRRYNTTLFTKELARFDLLSAQDKEYDAGRSMYKLTKLANVLDRESALLLIVDRLTRSKWDIIVVHLSDLLRFLPIDQLLALRDKANAAGRNSLVASLNKAILLRAEPVLEKKHDSVDIQILEAKTKAMERFDADAREIVRMMVKAQRWSALADKRFVASLPEDALKSIPAKELASRQ